jgi:hypothetical protein
MKLSEIRKYDAIETLADILEPIANILGSPETKERYEKATNRIQQIQALLKGHSKEWVQILARLDQVSEEEYDCDIFALPSRIFEVINDPTIQDFFKSQGLTMGGMSFGSATENTEETEETEELS